MAASPVVPTTEVTISQILTRLAVMEEKVTRLSFEVAMEAKLDRLSALVAASGGRGVATDAGDPNAIRLTPKQAMARLGISRATLDRAIATGALNPINVNGSRGRGKRIFLHVDEVAAFAVRGDAPRDLTVRKRRSQKKLGEIAIGHGASASDFRTLPVSKTKNRSVRLLTDCVKDLADRVTSGRIGRSRPWGVEGIMFSDSLPERHGKPGSSSNLRYVVTPQVKALCWLLRSLKRSFSVVQCNLAKDRFYDRLADAADRRINASPEAPPTAKELLLAVLEEARLLAKEFDARHNR